MGWIKNVLRIKDKVQPVSLHDDNFEDEVLNSNIPVLLDVWTPTCTHCDKLVPIIMNLAKRYEGRLKVTEVNGAESPQIMSRLGIRGTPTVLYFYQGQEVERIVGFRGSLYHQDFIENELFPLVKNHASQTQNVEAHHATALS